jgi:dipeptidyl aminopeptidase/acylaminoacyl peptidase
MPVKLSARWIAFVIAAALLALPSTAEATLVFVRMPNYLGNSERPTVCAAEDESSKAHRLVPGTNPRVSPDGQTVVYMQEGRGHRPTMKAISLTGGAARTLMIGWRETSYLAFSPDSQKVAALRGPELGKRKLVVIELASGAQRVIASGYFSGFSFSPDGSELVYSRAGSERFPPRTDVFRVALAGGKPVQITSDHISQDPLWGPTGQIVFVKLIEAKKRRYGPKSELYRMNPQGKQVRRLTHTKVAPLLIGLFPTDWSADGSRLLAEFLGQDTSYAVAVNPKTGAQRPVHKAGEDGFVATALSADGSTVLGFTGGFEPEPNHDVATVPYEGGKLTVIARNAFLPDWSR